jgi:pyruvate formate lyase activating enzyme
VRVSPVEPPRPENGGAPDGDGWQPADFWTRDAAPGEGQGAGDPVCTLCPFLCRFAGDGAGRCEVRRWRGDGLETATLSLPIRHLQPIERKPLYHFRPGRAALTLAAPGCTFRCDFCLNARFAHGEPAARAGAFDARAVVDEARRQGHLLAFSFSEPALAAEATLALHRHAAPAGVEIVWKSNGFLTPQTLERVIPALAAVNIDIKAADEAVHRTLSGGAALAPVLAAVEAFIEAGVWVELSTPIIPEVTGDVASLTALARTVRRFGPDVPWHLCRFHPSHRRARSAPASPGLLSMARAIGQEAGLRYVYVERALGPAGATTVCPGCGGPVVHRHQARTLEVRLNDGRCPACGTAVAGRWGKECV